ncbi:hypothetical protein [Methylomonas sp. DH-1]|uniref:hypothetical protein n=1 Tax=Methylomonas sp. (strain DH-1) TaxID=1727196 RepID=UPI0007C8F29A|nr:hypothetical protein [Methylomonas sp. DH-1]ANE53743.1 hypothetical protein AYM39_00155 [Methylomonas sp. DH-1]
MSAIAPTPSAALRSHWLVCAAMLLMLIVYNVVCQVWGNELQITVSEERRVLVRSVLYAVAIVLFPLTNLTKHILLRLNQTMPGPRTAGQRYFTTIAVSQALIEWVGLFGPIMIVLGDGFNTLYIFSLMHGLGIFLHRPKMAEYRAIVAALSARDNRGE